MQTKRKSSNKVIVFAVIVIALVVAAILAVGVVFALNQREIESSIHITYVAEDIDGDVTVWYKVANETNWTQLGDKISFDASDKQNTQTTPALTMDDLTSQNPYVEFKYEFVNNGDKYYTAVMSLTTSARENIALTYKYNDPDETKDYTNSKYAVVVPGNTDASNSKTYYIKVAMEDLAYSSKFAGTFYWTLKKYNPVTNEELVLTTLDYVENSSTGTYSAKYNGSDLEDNTLIIPSTIGDSAVTTV